MVDTAMIFAAGLGTRLAPLTHDRPKALVELGGKTLLQRTVDKLFDAGVRRFVINIHHFPQLMHKAIEEMEKPGAEFIISDETDTLLDTGGGLLKAAHHLQNGKPFIVHNVDVLSDIDFSQILAHHQQQGALATLAVSQRNTARYFLWDNNRLCGWTNVQTGEVKQCYPVVSPPVRLAFSGIHIIDPEIFNLISEAGIFSINQVYLRLAKDHLIAAYTHDATFWADLGTTEKLARAAQLLEQFPLKF